MNFILKKLILINLQIISKSAMSTQLRNIRGGQRVVCFYDQDRHSIDVGETMKAVCKSFIDSGMTPEQTAERMDVLVEYVNECMQ